jgi:hypothetical protein
MQTYMMMNTDHADKIRAHMKVGSSVPVYVEPTSYLAPILRGKEQRSVDNKGNSIHHMAAFLAKGGKPIVVPSTQRIVVGDMWAAEFLQITIFSFRYNNQGFNTHHEKNH